MQGLSDWPCFQSSIIDDAVRANTVRSSVQCLHDATAIACVTSMADLVVVATRIVPISMGHLQTTEACLTIKAAKQ